MSDPTSDPDATPPSEAPAPAPVHDLPPIPGLPPIPDLAPIPEFPSVPSSPGPVGSTAVPPPPPPPPVAAPPPPPGGYPGGYPPPVWEPTPSLAGGGPSGFPAPPGADPGGMHFLRYVSVYLAVQLAGLFTVVGGMIWMMIILDHTGYRKRDVINPVAGVRGVWRYTANVPYWVPRGDRPGGLPTRGSRRIMIVAGSAGYVLLVGLTALAVIAGGGGPSRSDRLTRRLVAIGDRREGANCEVTRYLRAYPHTSSSFDDENFYNLSADLGDGCPVGWSSLRRDAFVHGLENAGVEQSRAECMLSGVVRDYPDGALPKAVLLDAIRKAGAACP